MGMSRLGTVSPVRGYAVSRVRGLAASPTRARVSARLRNPSLQQRYNEFLIRLDCVEKIPLRDLLIRAVGVEDRSRSEQQRLSKRAEMRHVGIERNHAR